MKTVYVLVGMPGSGKSTWSQSKIQENCVWISSDEIRKELFNNENDRENHNIVFSEMLKRTKEALNKNISVIYDATNISSKKRISLLSQLNNCIKKCVYFSTAYNTCLDNNNDRSRIVQNEEIKRIYKNLQIPMYHEGWDEILIIGQRSNEFNYNVNTYDDYINMLNNDLLRQNIDLPHDNVHHTLSVSEHMYYTYMQLKNSNNNLKIASLLHDCGKPFCKIFKDGSKYANFYGHENVSAQLAIIYLLRCGLKDKDIIDISTYIQLHMKLLSMNDSYKAKEKFQKLVGNDVFNNLIEFNNADKSAK